MILKMARYLIIAVFIFTIFKAQVYAIKIVPTVPQELDDANLNKVIGDRKKTPEELIMRPKVEYKAQGLRNPFEQPILESENKDDKLNPTEAKPLPKLIVQGIIWDSNLPQAIVNNKVVKIGDILENADIIDINKEGVTVLFAGVEHKLTTLPDK